MRSLTILLFVLIPCHSFAQSDTLYRGTFWQPAEDTNRCYRVIVKHDSLWLKQDFFSRNNQLRMAGTFRDSFCSVRSGFFTRHLIDGTLVDSLLFVDNQVQQAWYFHDNGNKSAYEVYENKKLISSINWDEDGSQMGSDFKDSVFKSGYKTYKDYLEVNFDRDQPKAYTNGSIHGKVSIEFIIDKYGFVRDAKVRKTSGHPELDNHALNIIEKSPRFNPVRIHGRRIARKWIQPFSYDSLNPSDY